MTKALQVQKPLQPCANEPDAGVPVLVQDGDFSETRFRDTVNAYLANSVGNLLNRTQGLLKKNCSGTLPEAASSIPADNPLRVVAAEQAKLFWHLLRLPCMQMHCL